MGKIKTNTTIVVKLTVRKHVETKGIKRRKSFLIKTWKPSKNKVLKLGNLLR